MELEFTYLSGSWWRGKTQIDVYTTKNVEDIQEDFLRQTTLYQSGDILIIKK